MFQFLNDPLWTLMYTTIIQIWKYILFKLPFDTQQIRSKGSTSLFTDQRLKPGMIYETL